MSRILLVDDSSFQLRILFGMLQQLGYEVDTACNGQEALENIQAHPPDCLLLDMLMPIMNGVQLLEHMKSLGVTLPVIVLTADVQDSSKDRCLELGATTFLIKPVKQDQLRRVLQSIRPALQATEVPCT